MNQTYHTLHVDAQSPDTEIWLGDSEGHFVAHGKGFLHEGLLPGDYVVQFGLHGYKHPIHLDRDIDFPEEEQPVLEEKTPMLSNRILGAIVLALIVVAVLVSFISPANARTLGSCETALTNDELVSCLTLNFPEDRKTTLEQAVKALGKPLGKGVAIACPKDSAGEPIKEQCKVFPSLVHKIAQSLVVTVYTEHEGEVVLVHLSASALTSDQEDAIEQLGAPPGFQPI